MSLRYLARRLLLAAGAVAGILVATFAMVHAAPGDPLEVFASEGADQAQLDELRAHFGLDRPLPEQFLAYAGNVFRGDLGDSFVVAKDQAVAGVIRERLGATLLLTGTALVVSTIGGLALGALAARRPSGALDAGISTAALIAYAVPSFWLAQMAILTLGLHAGLFPVQGMTDARAQYTGLDHVVDVARHLVLPVLVLAASEVALLARVTRSGLLRQSGQGYVRTARAKGLAEERVVTRHALPNALLPVVTVIGTRVGFLISGAVLVETVFAWPGLGRLLVDASRNQDHPVILGMVFLVAFSVVAANLVTDLVYAWIDPRIRLR